MYLFEQVVLLTVRINLKLIKVVFEIKRRLEKSKNLSLILTFNCFFRSKISL